MVPSPLDEIKGIWRLVTCKKTHFEAKLERQTRGRSESCPSTQVRKGRAGFS